MRTKTIFLPLIASCLMTCNIAFSQTEVQVYSMAEIDSVWIHYFPIQYAMKRNAQMDSITDSPLYRLVSRWHKEWSETSVLSWDDFIPVDASEIGSNSTISITASVSMGFFKYRNTDYSYKNLTVAMDPGRSYYDPYKVDEWELRYDKVLFDLAELSAREAVRACNSKQDTETGDLKDCYEKIFEERKQTFIQQSGLGKDTTVVRDYENKIREELKKEPREYTPQEFGFTPTKHTWLDVGAHVGYLNNTIIGNGSEYLNPANGYTIGLEVGNRRLKLEGEFYALRYGKLRESDFYHDIYNDYDWSKDKVVNEAGIRLKAGYTVFTNEYIRITPVVGTSLGSLTQFTDKKQENSNHYIESKLPGNKDVLFGIDTDWVIWRDQDRNGITFSGLRFTAYGMYHNYKNLGDVWSLNLGISFITGK